jgi:hypothetical protein
MFLSTSLGFFPSSQRLSPLLDVSLLYSTFLSSSQRLSSSLRLSPFLYVSLLFSTFISSSQRLYPILFFSFFSLLYESLIFSTFLSIFVRFSPLLKVLSSSQHLLLFSTSTLMSYVDFHLLYTSFSFSSRLSHLLYLIAFIFFTYFLLHISHIHIPLIFSSWSLTSSIHFSSSLRLSPLLTASLNFSTSFYSCPRLSPVLNVSLFIITSLKSPPRRLYHFLLIFLLFTKRPNF